VNDAISGTEVVKWLGSELTPTIRSKNFNGMIELILDGGFELLLKHNKVSDLCFKR
jgi:hypothetical protein